MVLDTWLIFRSQSTDRQSDRTLSFPLMRWLICVLYVLTCELARLIEVEEACVDFFSADGKHEGRRGGSEESCTGSFQQMDRKIGNFSVLPQLLSLFAVVRAMVAVVVSEDIDDDRPTDRSSGSH